MVTQSKSAYFHNRFQNFGYKEDLEKHERTERHLLAEVARMSDPFRKLATKSVFNCDICQKVNLLEFSVVFTNPWTIPLYNAFSWSLLDLKFRFQSFGYQEDLDKHEKTETHKRKEERIKQLKLPKPVFNCEYCDLTFKSISSLDAHRSINHPGKRPYQESYTSPYFSVRIDFYQFEATIPSNWTIDG